MSEAIGHSGGYVDPRAPDYRGRRPASSIENPLVRRAQQAIGSLGQGRPTLDGVARPQAGFAESPPSFAPDHQHHGRSDADSRRGARADAGRRTGRSAPPGPQFQAAVAALEGQRPIDGSATAQLQALEAALSESNRLIVDAPRRDRVQLERHQAPVVQMIWALRQQLGLPG